jgi:hypothetical protein
MKRVLLPIAVAGFLTAACGEVLGPDHHTEMQLGKGVCQVQMTAAPILFDEGTKTTMSVDETSGLSFLWSEGDQAGVYPSDVTGLNLFTLSSGEGTGSAIFDGGGFTLTDAKKYYAFFPYDGTATDKTAIPLDYSNQVATKDNDIVSPMSRDYMWAEATSHAGNAGFSFSHIGSFVRLRLSGLPRGKTISKIQLVPMSSSQVTKTATYNITSKSVKPATKAASLDIATTVTVPAGGTSTIWAMMAPQDFGSTYFSVIATIDGNLYSARLHGLKQLGGKAYRWDVTPLSASSAPDHGFSATLKNQVQMSVTAGQYSGITYLGSNGDNTYNFAVVDDKLSGGGIVFFKIPIAANGTVNGKDIVLTVPEGTSGSSVTKRDNEDIVFDGESLWVSAEGNQSISKYNLVDGSDASEAFTTPSDMFRDSLSSKNAGFEALAYNAVTGKFWTTTELPLKKDSFQPRIHRLQRFSATHKTDARYLYQMDEPAATASDIASKKAYVFGIPAIVALDDGRLIVLEREVYVPNSVSDVTNKSFARIRLYVVDPQNDSAGILRKKLLTEFSTGVENLMSASLANYEGMCLGPIIGGRQSLVLIADSQGGMKTTLPIFGEISLTKEFIKIILL